MASIIGRRSVRLLLIMGLFGMVLAALVLMSEATENSDQFERIYSWLLIFSSAGLLILTLLIGYNLYRLVHQYRIRAPGARLTLRLVAMFAAIALAPLGVVYYFSLQLLQEGIDSWFDVRIEKGLEDALELSRASLDLRIREVLKQTVRMAEDLGSVGEGMAALSLSELRNESDATEIALFGQSGRIIAVASTDPLSIIPDRPPEVVLMHVRQGHDYVSLDPVRNFGFQIRAVVPVPSRGTHSEQRILQALFAVPDRFGRLADSVRAAFDNYKELIYLRGPLKTSFTLTLSLVLLLSILAAFWAAFYSARRLVAPVRDLAEGTRAVAAGQYDQQLPLSGGDELGFLVHSFNQMTRKLAQARDTAQRSQQLLERQRAYLEAVLARLSSGVLTLDQDGRLRTCNAAASQILGVDLSAYIGADPAHRGAEHNHLLRFFEIIDPHLSKAASDWRQEMTLFGTNGRQVLMCRGSSLPAVDGAEGGHVIVFDDITNLVQVERDAAWAEVARRLAHEIKNPLTPIQLAAERMRHKYLKTMNPQEEGRVFDRSTHTIIQQVQVMKEMVDAFRQYARPPQLRLVTVDLNEFVTEMLYMYRDYPAGVEIQLDLDPHQPAVKADTGRLQQLVHNVVQNAIDAMKDGQGSTLRITTRCIFDDNADYVELCFQDNGPGFPDERIGNIFEPYVTTKPKGTGLGLAIVKKIVEEHGGLIHGESPPEGGARIVIHLPVCSTAGEMPAEIVPTALLDSEEAG